MSIICYIFVLRNKNNNIMKKAYLVTFTATTRIVVESEENPLENDELFNEIVEKAFIQMGDLGFENYLSAENAEIVEDTECPAGTFDFD